MRDLQKILSSVVRPEVPVRDGELPFLAEE